MFLQLSWRGVSAVTILAQYAALMAKLIQVVSCSALPFAMLTFITPTT